MVDERHRVYELRDLLGRGGEGSVWRTDHPDLVIKIRDDDRAVAIDELRRVQRLPTQGLPVARPEALVTGERGVGFVMELERHRQPLEHLLQVDHTDVAGWWRTTGGSEGRLRLLAAAFAVLGVLHRRGLVVGDVSPRNLLAGRPNDPVPVVLIDPDGLHYPEEPPPGPPSVSVPHVAPEVFSGVSPHDARSDTYAAALLVAHVMLLQHPFRGVPVVNGPSEAELRVYGGELPWCYDGSDHSNPPSGSPRVLADLFGAELEGLLHRCFEAGRDEPALRPTSAAFAHALFRAADRCRRCVACGDGGPGRLCVACGQELVSSLVLEDKATGEVAFQLWDGHQRVLNRRLLTASLDDANDPVALITAGNDHVRLERTGLMPLAVRDGDTRFDIAPQESHRLQAGAVTGVPAFPVRLRVGIEAPA